MTREEILDRLLPTLAKVGTWHDVTGEEGTDPEAVQSLACGFSTKVGAIYILSRYEDEGVPFALVGARGSKPLSQVTNDPVRLRSLWSQITYV
jgi:hypothetical protein